jgi:ADP-heptose:LPS heptosyltransferase
MRLSPPLLRPDAADGLSRFVSQTVCRDMAWAFTALAAPLAVVAPDALTVLGVLLALFVAGAWIATARWRWDRLSDLDLSVGGVVAWVALSSVWSPSPHAPMVGVGVASLLGAASLLPRLSNWNRMAEGFAPWQAGVLALSVPFGSLLLGVLTQADALLPGRSGMAAAVLALACWPAGVALRGWIAAWRPPPTGRSAWLHDALPTALPTMTVVMVAVAVGEPTVLAGLAVGGSVFVAATVSVRAVRVVLGTVVVLLFATALPLALGVGTLFPPTSIPSAPTVPDAGPPASWPWDWTDLWSGVAGMALKAPVLGHGLDSTRVLLPRAIMSCKPPQRTFEGRFVGLTEGERLAVARSLGYAGSLGSGGLTRYLAVHPDLYDRFTAMDAVGRWTVPVEDHPCAPRIRTLFGSFAELAPDDRYAVARGLGYYQELGKGGLSRHLDAHPEQKQLFQVMEGARRWPVHDRHRACAPQARALVGRFRDLPAEDQRAVAQSLGYWGPLGQGGLSRHLAIAPGEAARFDDMERELRWRVHTVFCPETAWALAPVLDGGARLGWWPTPSAPEEGPIHPRNGFLQLWLELGEAGVALLAFLALGLLARTRRLPTTAQPAALALFAGALVTGGVAGGSTLLALPVALPWMAGLLAAGLALRVRVASGAGAEAGGILIIHMGTRVDALLLQEVFAAIRHHHQGQRAVLLTNPALAAMARGRSLFDEVWEGPIKRTPTAVLGLRMRLRNGCFNRIYDLQIDRRSSWLHGLCASDRWLGGLEPMMVSPMMPMSVERDVEPGLPALERCHRRLASLGIGAPLLPDLSWLGCDTAGFGLPPHYALLAVEGTSARAVGLWPVAHQAELARALLEAGVRPVVVGTTAAMKAAAELRARCPDVIDLTVGTSLPQLASLARGAVAAVGAGSPLLHLVAAVGCPTVALAIGQTPPPPAGPRVRWLTAPTLPGLEAVDILAAVVKLVDAPGDDGAVGEGTGVGRPDSVQCPV